LPSPFAYGQTDGTGNGMHYSPYSPHQHAYGADVLHIPQGSASPSSSDSPLLSALDTHPHPHPHPLRHASLPAQAQLALTFPVPSDSPPPKKRRTLSHSQHSHSRSYAHSAEDAYEEGDDDASGGRAKIHICPICARCFSRSHDMRRHIRGHSEGSHHKCDACGRGFRRLDAVKRHLRTACQGTGGTFSSVAGAGAGGGGR